MRNISQFISDRANLVDASGIRKVFDLAATMKDPINLSIGQPDFDVPDSCKEAAIEAIRKGFNRYTQTQGINQLISRVHADLTKELGRDPGEVFVTSGVSGGLMLAVLALINPGDEAVCLDPYFVMYKHLMTMAGGKLTAVDSYPDFRFYPERVEKAITPRTKLLILNSPGNPSGYVMTREDVQAAVDLARKHDLIILSDEIYKEFTYCEGADSPAKFYDRTLVLRGYSKSHAMTGWRLGYAAGPGEIIQQMLKLQQYTFVCAPSPLQLAAVTAEDVSMAEQVAAYRRKRDLVYNKLSSKFQIVKPEGAFYMFPKAPDGITATDFVTRAIENNVLIIPGNVFSSQDTHFRISYATTDEKLEKGCDILNSLV